MRSIIKLLGFVLTLFMLSCTSTSEQENTPYEANWESLSKHNETPEWFADAKFGMYFHWGIYSVPAYKTEWYPYHVYRNQQPHFRNYHEENYGPLTEFNYHDFIPMFTGEKFDAENWADLFQQAGAKFGGPVAQHHDGFAMWDSEVNPWNAADMGPKKDITGEFFKALEKRDIKTIATFHHARLLQRYAKDTANWDGYDSHFAYHPDYATSSTDPELAKFYGNIPADEFHDYWLEQVNEVVTKYNPDIIWYDAWLNLIPENYLQQMCANYLNHAQETDQEVLIGYKQYDLPLEVGVLDIEQGGKKDLSERVWMTDITLSDKGSWCYTEGQVYKNASMVVRNMVDVWSKNGVVLLNISPMTDGTINREQRDVLAEIGDWMNTYGEAVYETRPYFIYGYGNAKASDGAHGGQSAKVKYTGNDIRFTWSKDKKSIYVFTLGVPNIKKPLMLKKFNEPSFAPPTPIKRIVELSSGTEVKWEKQRYGITLFLPEIGYNQISNVFKIELE